METHSAATSRAMTPTMTHRAIVTGSLLVAEIDYADRHVGGGCQAQSVARHIRLPGGLAVPVYGFRRRVHAHVELPVRQIVRVGVRLVEDPHDAIGHAGHGD